MWRIAVLVLFSTFLITSPVDSRLSAFSVAVLIRDSRVIVTATVTDVSERESREGKYLVATARVDEALKGAPIKAVHFRASPGAMADDASQAKKGDSVLLFLDATNTSIYSVAAFGRGYMPLREVGDSQYATYWGEVILPKDAPVISAPEPNADHRHAVLFSYLRQLINRQLHERAAT
jgi:hypothetical protein